MTYQSAGTVKSPGTLALYPQEYPQEYINEH